LLSLGDFRAPTFSLSVTRADGGLEDEFELFMQLLGTYFSLLSCSLVSAAGSHCVEYRQCRLYGLSEWMRKRGSDHEAYCTECRVANTE
jgi:hypothetical protein